MGTKLLKQGLYFIFLVLLCNGCEVITSQEIEPGISIYKTRGDYFDLVDIGMKADKVFRRSSFSADHSKLIFTNNDTIYRYRLKLINGYILDREADERYDVFLSLTFKKHLNLEREYGLTTLPDDTLKLYILDSSPYTEFYRENGNHKKFDYPDTAVINSIIRENRIEEFFNRIK